MLFEATIIGCLLLGVIIVSLITMRRQSNHAKLIDDLDDVESNLVDELKRGEAKNGTKPDQTDKKDEENADKKGEKKEESKGEMKNCDPASPSDAKKNPVVPDVRAKPNMVYLDREKDGQIAGWQPETTSYGPVKLVKRLRNWAFQSFQGQFTESKSVMSSNCTVMYQVSEVGHRDPLVNMFEVCKQLEGRDITPKALYLSDAHEYEASHLFDSRYDMETMGSERFLVLEFLRDSVKSSFAFADWKKKEVVQRFIRYVLEALDLVERFHKAGYYAGNLDANSFYIRDTDGKLVLGNLWEAEPSYYGGNKFQQDLAAISKLLDVMDWHHHEMDPAIFTDEMLHDLDEIHPLIAKHIGWGIYERPKYSEVRRILEKYV